jgi:NAD(P)-dependent dehydrogenase (short-subunit alcohol dehydrogenase family)
MLLEGKVALITGSGGGMGRASALLFARQGARVVGTDKNGTSGEETARLLRAEGFETHFITANVSDRAAWDDIVAGAVDKFGKLDILFLNSGSDEGSGDLLSVSVDEVEACIASNLKSAIYGCQAAIPHLVAAGGGAIVTTCSITGLRGQDHLGVYGAAKAGAINFTRYLAWAYGPQGIRANAICPGAIDTPLLRAGMADPSTKPVMTYFMHQAPLHRLGQPIDIANTALFLASDMSAHITGQAIPVDGGMTCGTFLDGGRLRDFAHEVMAG